MRSLNGKLSALLLCALLCWTQAAEAGSFSDLQKLLDETQGTAALAENYAYDEQSDAGTLTDEGIIIRKGVTIDGGGFTIDAMGMTRIFKIDTAEPVAISNVTLTKGGATKVASGGGVYIAESANVTFEDVDITECGTVKGVHTKDGGAAVFIDTKAKVTFTNCAIKDNTGSDRAGGLYMRGKVEMRGCTISGNSSGSRGGGIYVDPGNEEVNKRGGEWGGNLKMYGCTVSGNKGGRGGGIYVNSENDELNYFEDCVISSNDVSDNSVGNGGGILFYNAHGELAGCTIENNKAKNGGGIILDVESELKLSNCKILDNAATVGGAGLYSHDGSHADQPMLPAGVAYFKECVITGNKLEDGTAQDLCVHYSANDDKDMGNPELGWEPRFDGKFVSEGGNVIGVVDMSRPEGVSAEDPIKLQPSDKVEQVIGSAAVSGGSGGGCNAGFLAPALAAALGLFVIRRKTR